MMMGGPEMMMGQPAQQGGGDERAAIQILKQMIDLARQYQEVEPDEEDKATMAKVTATLQQYLAKDQQDTQKALGGDSSIMRVLRRAS